MCCEAYTGASLAQGGSMKFGRTIAMLCTTFFALCSTALWTQSAQAADPAPTQGVWYEVFEPFSPFKPECVDDPRSNRLAGTEMTLFSCHSGGNQLWQFVPSIHLPGSYNIVNHDSG